MNQHTFFRDQKTLFGANEGTWVNSDNLDSNTKILAGKRNKLSGTMEAAWVDAEEIAPATDNNAKVVNTPAEFKLASNITNITIPEGVTSLGNSAFSACTNLETVIIPEGITSIGASAFNSCSSLTEIILPESLTSIGNSAFTSCSALTSITIPSSVETIGSSAFSSCRSLETITINAAKDSISGAPWGAPNSTTIVWNG